MKKYFYALCIWALLVAVPTKGQTQSFEFDSGFLGTEWQFVNQPDYSKYVVRDGKLRIYGSPYELADTTSAPTSFLALPLTDSPKVIETHLTLFDAEKADEAGLCIYRSHNGYLQCYMYNNLGELRLRLRLQLLSHHLQFVEKPIALDHHDLWLRVVCDDKGFSFYYSLDDKKYQYLDYVEKRLLSPAVLDTNAPLLVGMYSFMGSGKYHSGYSFADFDYFRITPSPSGPAISPQN